MAPHASLRWALLPALCLLIASCDSLEDSSVPLSSPPLLHVEVGGVSSAKLGIYADTVVAAIQGQEVPSGPVAPSRSDPNSALGAPDTDFFSLGFDRLETNTLEGELVLGFARGYRLKALTGTVFEETYGSRAPLETADVYVSEEASGPWHYIGTARNDGTAANTRPTAHPANLCTRFVRLVDRTDRALFVNRGRRGDGFDVNAVRVESDGGCAPSFSISGTVFADADADAVRDASESGLEDVVVRLEQGPFVYTATTTDQGTFAFSVPAGAYTLSIPATAAGHFNAMLYSTHTYTGSGAAQQTVTVGPDRSDADFGFEMDVRGVTSDLLTGKTPTKGKGVIYWERQFRLAILQDSLQADVAPGVLAHYLNEVERLLLPVPFQFGPGNYFRFRSAHSILGGPAHGVAAVYQRELLTAELNVVSGCGTASLAFDHALLAYAESISTSLPTPRTIRPDASSKSGAAAATPEEVINLLRAFNGSGGGVGGPR